MTRLTVARVKALTEPGRYGDRATLFLLITPGGTKNWVQRISIAGRRADLGLGAYPAIGLTRESSDGTLYYGHRITVLKDRNKPLKTSTLRGICKQFGIDPNDL